MKWTLAAAAVAGAALALAPAAGAKEIKEAQICGADGCTTVNDEGDRALLVSGGPPRTPPTAAPFYAVRITMDEGGEQAGRFEAAAVPRKGALRGGDGTWMQMPAVMARVVERYAAGHRPYPAARLAGAAPAAPPAESSAGEGVLWPEGALLALALLGAAGVLARRAARRGRLGPA
jgi:hypothetical protein